MKAIPLRLIIDESICIWDEFTDNTNQVLMQYGLFLAGKLNRKALTERFKIIREGKHWECKNLYHDRIRDEWYERTTLNEIWRDQTAEFCYDRVLTMEEVWTAFKLYFGKKDSWVNWFVREYVYSAVVKFIDLERSSSYYSSKAKCAMDLDLPAATSWELEYSISWCCDDCDGSYSSALERAQRRWATDNWVIPLKARFGIRD